MRLRGGVVVEQRVSFGCIRRRNLKGLLRALGCSWQASLIKRREKTKRVLLRPEDTIEAVKSAQNVNWPTMYPLIPSDLTRIAS